MKKIFFISSSFITLIALSCTKHANDLEETMPRATIQILSPLAGAVYNSGDSVNIKAVAISTASIHGYDLIIRRANDTAQLYFNHVHEHNDTLQIDTRWKAAISNVSLEAEIVLYLDHDGHTGMKKTNFKVK
ncbi:MAG: hypothetical protein JWR72_3353 [Flavisolibacter sp.]|jgi:hypothetical protein|nr:hypothetical protein [Flavisolibacter sp.]